MLYQVLISKSIKYPLNGQDKRNKNKLNKNWI